MASFLGDEAFALRSAGMGPSDDPTLPPDATAQDAVAAIVEAARDRRVVMLNEAHVASRHRHFLARLLRALRPLGFEILAAEDFVNASGPGAPDVRTYRAGTALNSNFGFYLHDPVYGEAVREAADLGYRLAAYEQRREQRQAGETGAAAIARREPAQAENFIADVLAANPKARVLVHVGYAHLRKTPRPPGPSVVRRPAARQDGYRPALRLPGLYRLVRPARRGSADHDRGAWSASSPRPRSWCAAPAAGSGRNGRERTWRCSTRPWPTSTAAPAGWPPIPRVAGWRSPSQSPTLVPARRR
jgi:hypothetical protein